MRKLTFILMCLAVSLSVSAQKRKTVKADGPVVKQERSVGDFAGIKVSTGINVYLTQGNGFNCDVETEENLHEYIMTEVKDDVLHVFAEVNIKNSKSLNVYVTMEDIKMLSTSSAGDIIGENKIKADEIELNASSAGDIKLELTANTILADCSSAGDIILSGQTGYLKASASSSGDFKAGDLKVKEANVSASSSGDAIVNVSEKLHATASSAGDVRYYGDPEVNAEESSGGSVKRK